MQITVFAKKRTSREGKPFTVYVSRMTKKDGSEVSVSVKFKDECGSPKPEDCPLNIVFEQRDGNLSAREYTVHDEDGVVETKRAFTLWLSNWREGEPYEDHSLDEFF